MHNCTKLWVEKFENFYQLIKANLPQNASEIAGFLKTYEKRFFIEKSWRFLEKNEIIKIWEKVVNLMPNADKIVIFPENVFLRVILRFALLKKKLGEISKCDVDCI